MKKLIISIVCAVLISGCSAMQKKADGRYFDFASNNNSEASIELEKVIVDGQWHAPATGVLGCGSSNINGAGRVGSPSYDTPAPQNILYLEWYAWREKARMKATIKLPGREVINSLLLNPPWKDPNKNGPHRSKFIIDFRPGHKVWIKLAKSAYPKSQDDIMILAEGQGIKTDDVVTRYLHFTEGKDYILDCVSRRERLKELGYYTAPLVVYDDWYTEVIQNMEVKDGE